MKEKRRKIVARVGAMVAAVLLVALFVLPCAAVNFPELSQGEVVENIIDAYGLTSWSPVAAILRGTNNLIPYKPNETPYVIQFRLPSVGDEVKAVGSFLTKNIEPTYLGAHVVHNNAFGGENGFSGYGNGGCYVATSHTTNAGNKFVYFDIYDTWGKAVRMRIKYGTNDRIVLETTVETYIEDGVINSNLSGDGEDFFFALSVSEENWDVIRYGLVNGFLVEERDMSVNYWDFKKGLVQGQNIGYVYGEQDGYNDGMSQTSLLDGVTAIFRAPMELIDGVLDFNIMGINLAGAVHVIITMAIIGVVITIIWKAVK